MRSLVRLPVPPGAPGVRALWDALPAALDGTGPAIAPVPTTSTTLSTAAVQRILDANRPGEPLESDDVAVVLSTSGSTQHPRGVLLSAAALDALSAAVNASAQCGDVTAGSRPQWVAAIPVTSAGGMNVVMRALAAGREPIALPSIGGAAPFTPALFAEGVTRAHAVCDDVRVSLVSAQVRRLLADDAGTDALRACTQVLVGGGPLDALAREAAENAGVRLVSTYGATETAGGCVFDGFPLPGVTLRIDGSSVAGPPVDSLSVAEPGDGGRRDGDPNATAPLGEPGEVVVSGPMLALGYRLDPATTAARFVVTDGVREYRTGDLGVIADGVLRITGRMDDVVVVNGVNVSVVAVESAVKALHDVGDAAVVAVPTATEPRIVAFVVARDGSSAASLADAVKASVRERLGTAAAPRDVRILPALPTLPTGKPDRLALRSLAAS